MKKSYAAVGLCAMSLFMGFEDARAQTFGADAALLREHTDAFVLSDEAGRAQIVVVPQYQGRVMTSTTGGADGPSFGWINRELIASGKTGPHMNAFGGEDRFWLGPEGGQFALYFKKGDPFEFDYWQTPALIDTEPFELVAKSPTSAVFTRDGKLTNYAGAEFTFRVDRAVNLLDAKKTGEFLGLAEVHADVVAYESINTLTNTGSVAWNKETGVMSIWILGMFTPSAETTVVIPIRPGADFARGPKVNDSYFGKVPADRLRVEEDVLFFKGDGAHRSKIGISPMRAQPICGSYDAAGKALTLVQFNQPEGATDYVNSMWEIQKEPFAGDVVNSYNDGPPEPGAKPMGPFYELETSSPAAELKPGESITHIHRTFHFQGDDAVLDDISTKALGVSLNEIERALTH